jgi:hypothetical protein
MVDYILENSIWNGQQHALADGQSETQNEKPNLLKMVRDKFVRSQVAER